MIDLILVFFLSITILWIFITIVTCRHNVTTIKKHNDVMRILNYIPAILLLPTYVYYIGKYFTHGYILKYVPNYYMFILGILMLLIALIIYSDSIITMGKMWTIGLELRKNHRVIKDHCYKFIRHPIYTAWYLIIIATYLIIQHSYILLFLIPVFGWYHYRAVLEENMLARNLEGYSEYKSKTKRYIPFIF